MCVCVTEECMYRIGSCVYMLTELKGRKGVSERRGRDNGEDFSVLRFGGFVVFIVGDLWVFSVFGLYRLKFMLCSSKPFIHFFHDFAIWMNYGSVPALRVLTTFIIF